MLFLVFTIFTLLKIFFLCFRKVGKKEEINK